MIERAVIMANGPMLELRASEFKSQKAGPGAAQTLEEAERAHITETLRATNWVVGGQHGAAAQLGLPRTTLIAMMNRLGIRRETLGREAAQPDQPFLTVPGGSHHSYYTTRNSVFHADRIPA